MANRPIFYVGHSLAAARAHLAAFGRIRRGMRVDGVYAFAPPNPGDRHIGLAYPNGFPAIDRKSVV